MQAQQPEAAGNPVPSRRHRRILLAALALVILAAAVLALLLRPSAPLTASEQALVGKWKFRRFTNPPQFVLELIFWLQPDHTLQVGQQTGIDKVTTFNMTGTWRLEGDSLILSARGHEKQGEALARMFGQAPNPPEISIRMRLLRREGDVLFIEADDGSEQTILRLPE